MEWDNQIDSVLEKKEKNRLKKEFRFLLLALWDGGRESEIDALEVREE